MGVNRWSPEQWRAYNRTTGDRHVNRALPPISLRELIRTQDAPQELALARLERRRDPEKVVDDFVRRELGYLIRSRPLPDE